MRGLAWVLMSVDGWMDGVGRAKLEVHVKNTYPNNDEENKS